MTTMDQVRNDGKDSVESSRYHIESYWDAKVEKKTKQKSPLFQQAL
jgi:hypothetical protein